MYRNTFVFYNHNIMQNFSSKNTTFFFYVELLWILTYHYLSTIVNLAWDVLSHFYMN